jgi:hypothetical protein
LGVFLLLFFYGFDYYSTPGKERFYHSSHETLKPNGLIGHGIGIAGSVVLLVGVFGYMARKRIRLFSRIGYLKYWLEFHIFLCSLGPVLILYHTTFKFGGIVAISFWSMVAVVVSGIIGRFIYIQIPRTIDGRELSVNEIINIKTNLIENLKKEYKVDEVILSYLGTSTEDKTIHFSIRGIIKSIRREKIVLKKIKGVLEAKEFSKKERKVAFKLIKNEIILTRRIHWLVSMQNLLRYWHVAHLPFALVMLVIMIIHVIIAVTFGYKWIF